jgi:hypothetical protein
MSNKMKKYPKIKQFKDIFRKVRSRHDFKGYEEDGVTPIYEHTEPYPILNFQGTVKLHGTNAAVGFDENGEMWLQSRNRVLTLQRDNAEFAHFVHSLPEEVHQILKQFSIIWYGEFIGAGIQKGVAISELDKMFIIFNVRYLENEEIGNKWIEDFDTQFITDKQLNILNENRIGLISQFPMYDIKIDFNSPELSQNILVELTRAVGDECPVGKSFGVTGTGEGIVWKCIDPGFESSDFWFKVKDERHSVSKVKKLANIDVEKVNSINEFVNVTVTENRLKQGIQYFEEMKIPFEKNKTGEFIKWVKNDIIAEDFDILKENGLTLKDVGGAISRRSSQFYLKYVESVI